MTNGSSTAAPGNGTLERKIIFLLMVLAAVHVFIFSAAFPFFNNVDEGLHFDLVLKYAQGHFPQGREMVSPSAAIYLALMNSHEYLGTSNQFSGGQLPPPPWTLPAAEMNAGLAARSADWRKQENYEVSQTPLYYALAGFWWHIGQWLGFDERRILYWLRFLNIALVAATVWVAYFAARKIFPDNIFLRIGVPALLAFMPQTAFYSIGNDVLSPLCFGLTFLFLLKWLEDPSASAGGLTGLAFAATYLSKITNLPLLLIVMAAAFIKTVQSYRQKFRRPVVEALIAFLFCAEPPIIAWMIWCKSNFGDLTGSAVKTQFLGWTVKPFSQWWHHPIFTPDGLWTFLSGQLGTFWQGEFYWHRQPMALPGTNIFYTLLSLVLLAAAAPALFRRFSNDPAQRYSLRVSMVCFAAMLAFFALLSVIYDFHNCPYPSRQYPFFISGRLLLGALVPFLVLVVYGLDRILNRFGNVAKFSVLTLMVAAMVAVEIATDRPVFSSEYNWFHLP